VVQVSAQVREELVAQLCARNELYGSLSDAEVERYAAILMWSPRHVRRMVAAAEKARSRRRYELSDVLLDGFFARNGNATAAHKQLGDAGVEVPSVRTVQRVIRRELKPGSAPSQSTARRGAGSTVSTSPTR
jgi:hypothetical protein